MKKFILLILIFVSLKTIAQSELHCGSSLSMEKLFRAHPDLKAKLEKRELQKKNGTASNLTANYTIPIVFHILHTNGSENISDAQVKDAVQILNRDFAKQNADTSIIIPSFKTVADSTGIHFALAKLDPNGNCTNGIIRHYSADADWDDSSPSIYSYTWDPTQYLNVYVVRKIILSDGFNAAGYTYLPGSFAYGDPWDAIVVLHNYLGSIGTSTPYTSRVLTHEIGHWFNLLHVFGWNSAAADCNNDDYVNDTPTTPGYLNCPSSSTPSSYQICTPGVDENFQNYMDYSYCSKMFTHDQAQRMRDALNDNAVGRNNLWSSTNLTATGVFLPEILCKAEFKTNNTTNTVCEGGSIVFTDLSSNGHPTAWNWSFPGGTPTTSTDSMPTIHYNTAGTFDVSLTVSNNTGSKTITKSAYITVNSSTASITNSFYTESFEGTSLTASNWKVRNPLPGGNTWAQTAAASITGLKSVMITNTDSSNTAVDELISPSINMTNVSGSHPMLTFKVANAQRTSTTADKLQIYASINCGVSWSLRKTITGTALSTAGVQASSFIPTTNQWVKQSIALSGYSNQTDLYLMFRFTSNGGNNIYIDDINIGDTTLASVNEKNTSISDFELFPNPMEKSTKIAFSTQQKQTIDLTLLDINSKKIATIYNGPLNSGEHTFSLNELNVTLASGIYIVKLTMDNTIQTKKLIVK